MLLAQEQSVGSIIIKEEDGSKCIELPLPCWSALKRGYDNINEGVSQLREKISKVFQVNRPELLRQCNNGLLACFLSIKRR